MPKFSREFAPGIFAEMKPLIELHYREIAHYQDIDLDPDWDAYQRLEENGLLRVFTSRCHLSGKLIGYGVFIVGPNIHYKNSVQAKQDILFIDPTRRGHGARFILFCDKALKEEGVQVVYHHTKATRDFGPLLERMGYERIDFIYGKRLDTEVKA